MSGVGGVGVITRSRGFLVIRFKMSGPIIASILLPVLRCAWKIHVRYYMGRFLNCTNGDESREIILVSRYFLLIFAPVVYLFPFLLWKDKGGKEEN